MVKARRAMVLALVVFGLAATQSSSQAEAGVRRPKPATTAGNTGAFDGLGNAASMADMGGGSTKGNKPAQAPPPQRVREEPTDDRSPLSRIPWAPLLLGVAFFVTVRRLARLT